MADNIDPGRLLRRKWNDPDELARELYVMLSQTHGLLGGIGRSPYLLPRDAVNHGFHPGPNFLAGNGRVLRAQAQARGAARIAVRNLIQRRPIPEPGQEPAIVPRPLGQAPGPPAVAVNKAGIAALPPALRREYAAQASSDIGLARQFARAVRPRVSPGRRQSYAPLPTVAPTVQGRPIRVSDASQPVQETPLRGLASVPPVAPTRPDDRRQTMSPVRPPYRTDVERMQPRPEASQTIDITPGQRPDFAPDASDSQEAYNKHRETDDWQSRFTRIPLPSMGRILMAIDQDGIPGANFSSGGDSANPGSGQAYVLDFDGSQLTFYNGAGPQNVYNMSLLPISGGQVVVVFLIGEYWFIEPPIFCHGVVSEDIQPCDGTNPGSGNATTYYLQGGSISAGTDVQVENWYSVTAMSGTNCGLMCVDGTVSLEVLDCNNGGGS